MTLVSPPVTSCCDTPRFYRFAKISLSRTHIIVNRGLQMHVTTALRLRSAWCNERTSARQLKSISNQRKKK